MDEAATPEASIRRYFFQKDRTTPHAPLLVSCEANGTSHCAPGRSWDPPRCLMRHDQNAHSHRLGLAEAVATVLLLTPVTHAAPTSDSVSGGQDSAALIALSIAGVSTVSCDEPAATHPASAH